MANKSVVTPGQSFFAKGLEPRQRILMDSTKEISAAANLSFVQGFPLSLTGSTTNQGKLASKLVASAETSDVFYGINGININNLRGETSLGESTADRSNAELQGIYTLRRSTFLDATNSEILISPFTGFSGANGFPVATDIGKTIDAIEVLLDIDLGGDGSTLNVLKWGVGGGSDTGFANVAVILDVRENEEVDLLLPGTITNGSTSV